MNLAGFNYVTNTGAELSPGFRGLGSVSASRSDACTANCYAAHNNDRSRGKCYTACVSASGPGNCEWTCKEHCTGLCAKSKCVGACQSSFGIEAGGGGGLFRIPGGGEDLVLPGGGGFASAAVPLLLAAGFLGLGWYLFKSRKKAT